MAKDLKNVPFVKIAAGVLVLWGGYEILKATGLISTKVKKEKCNVLTLSSWELQDGTKLKFNPIDFVAELDQCYRGTNYTPNPCNHLLRLLAENMTDNDIRCAHNSWIKLIDGTESIWAFLDWQSPWYNTDESKYMIAAKKRLVSAGVKDI